jgi:ribonuclease BN (tRNA processing enzyme)
MVKFLILGAGTALPLPTRNAAAYWVELDGRGILLDPGPGALIRLVTSGHGPADVDGIDTVLLTHLHIDHCNDLAPLLFALHSPIPTSTAPLQLFGPPGTASFLARLKELYGAWIQPAKRELQVTEIDPGQVLCAAAEQDSGWTGDPIAGTARIQAYPVLHPQDRFSQQCLCYRFTDQAGTCVTYSGDTEPCPGLEEASRAVDLLVVECSTPDELATPGHMTPSRVGQLAAATSPGHVVLTHIYPPAAALDLPALVGEHYAGQVTVAQDGDVFTLREDPGSDGT